LRGRDYPDLALGFELQDQEGPVDYRLRDVEHADASWRTCLGGSAVGVAVDDQVSARSIHRLGQQIAAQEGP
jgi:hypothetical protein